MVAYDHSLYGRFYPKYDAKTQIQVTTCLMPGASNDGREDSPGGVITGEAGLAHAGAIVNDKSSNVLVTHGGR